MQFSIFTNVSSRLAWGDHRTKITAHKKKISQHSIQSEFDLHERYKIEVKEGKKYKLERKFSSSMFHEYTGKMIHVNPSYAKREFLASFPMKFVIAKKSFSSILFHCKIHFTLQMSELLFCEAYKKVSKKNHVHWPVH